jgi:hypothetical protein
MDMIQINPVQPYQGIPGFIHVVERYRTTDSPTGYSIVTAGLTNYGHPEIEIVHKASAVSSILQAAIILVMDGISLLDNNRYERILKNDYQPQAILMPSGRIRLILPDEQNRTDIENMDTHYSIQHIPSGREEELH